MIPVSETYAPYTSIRNVGALIKFGVVDANSYLASTASNDAGAVGALADTINAQNEQTARFASLERNAWLLDGTFDLIGSSDAEETGWWSESASGADCTFETTPYIHYTFPVALSTIGWTIYFDKTGNYASQLKLTLYDQDGAEVFAQEYAPTGSTFKAASQQVDYYGLRIDFLKTSVPFRRVHISEFVFGLVENLDSNHLESVSFVHGVSLTTESFPSKEIEFAFDNSDKRYNLLDPDGIYEFLQDGQSIDASVIVNGETVPMGRYYLSSVNTGSSVLVPRVTGNDVALSLDGDRYINGRNETVTLAEAVADILAGTDAAYEVDASVADRTVALAIPTSTTRREALRLVAQAAMVNVWADRDDTIIFREIVIADDPVDTLTDNELYNYNGISVSERVDGIKLLVKNSFAGTDVEYSVGSETTTKTIENPCVAAANGDAVAAWLLERINYRRRYNVPNRGNPAIEIGDTARIYDIFGLSGLAVVTNLEMSVAQGMSCTTGAIGRR